MLCEGLKHGPPVQVMHHIDESEEPCDRQTAEKHEELALRLGGARWRERLHVCGHAILRPDDSDDTPQLCARDGNRDDEE